MVDKAVELAETHGWFLTRQFENEANADIHSRTTAREILDDFAGERLDYWVTGFGTGGTLKGVARVLAQGAAGDQDRRLRAGQRADARQRHRRRRATPTARPPAGHPAFKPHPMQGWTPDFIPKLTGDAVDAEADRPASLPIAGAEAMRLQPRAGAARKASSSASPPARRFAGALQVAAERAEGRQHPLHAARHRRALPDHAAVRRHPGRHDAEELAISRSTPGAQLPA